MVMSQAEVQSKQTSFQMTDQLTGGSIIPNMQLGQPLQYSPTSDMQVKREDFSLENEEIKGEATSSDDADKHESTSSSLDHLDAQKELNLSHNNLVKLKKILEENVSGLIWCVLRILTFVFFLELALEQSSFDRGGSGRKTRHSGGDPQSQKILLH